MANVFEALNEIFKEMFIGTERAFRGLTIVFFIYGAGCFLGLMLISQLTQAHVKADEGTTEQSKLDDITSKKEDMDKVLLIIGSVMMGLSVVCFVAKLRYKGITGLSAKDIKDRKEFKKLE